MQRGLSLYCAHQLISRQIAPAPAASLFPPLSVLVYVPSSTRCFTRQTGCLPSPSSAMAFAQVNCDIRPRNEYNVQLYVWDLTLCHDVVGCIPRNMAAVHSFFTFGRSIIPHTSIVIDNYEYSFGKQGYQCAEIGPGAYDKLIEVPRVIGRTSLTRKQINSIVASVVLIGNFTDRTYNVLSKNCLHFSDALLNQLIDTPLPDDVWQIFHGYSWAVKSSVNVFNKVMTFVDSPLVHLLLPRKLKLTIFASASVAASGYASNRLYTIQSNSDMMRATRYIPINIHIPFRVFGSCSIVFLWNRNRRPLLRIITPFSYLELDVIHVMQQLSSINFSDWKNILTNFHFVERLSPNGNLTLGNNSFLRITPNAAQIIQCFTELRRSL